MKTHAFPILIALTLATQSAAQEAPALHFPVDCTLGETCFIQQVMDRDPGPGARDFTCGPQSYDGHTGTDIRVADMAAMADGVSVTAAMPGTVRAIRDGVPDGGTATMPEGHGCGNGVVISHANGWETQYCHLMRGSVTVAAGDTVTAGAILGEIGYSGRTEFPHLELILRRNGQEVDPFDPSDLSRCGAGAQPLWAEPVPFAPGGLLRTGFSGDLPAFDAIKAGRASAARLPADGPALVLWGYVFGGQAGDLVRLQITAPDGTLYHRQEVTLDRTQAELFRASGRRISTALAPGLYTGEVTLLRDGVDIHSHTTTVIVN